MLDPQDDCCCECRKCRNKNCLEVILGLLTAAFAVVLGIIVGANFATSILAATSALAVLIAILALLIVITLILLACNRRIC